jgi:hypothetical protein
VRIGRAVVALALAALAGTAVSAGAPRGRPTVPCSDVIAGVASGRENGYRIVLGVVSVPPSYLRVVVPTRKTPWPYWRKAGIAVRAGGAAVTLAVPRKWRRRAAITWGNDTGIVSSLRIARCGPQWPGKRWNAYAGGFLLRSRAACVPLVVRVGSRAATVHFGLGRRCASQ